MAKDKSNQIKWMAIGALMAHVSVPLLPPVHACAPMPERLNGKKTSVKVTGEAAIIWWDAKTKTEHFIRRADFDTNAQSIGFLVPTPSVPEIKESDDAIFAALEKSLEPKVITRVREGYRVDWFLSGPPPEDPTAGVLEEELAPAGAPGAPGAPAGAAVQVLQEKTVGAYATAVLAANDVDALGRWLQKNNFDNSADLREWLRPYVEKGWKVTTFKVSSNANRETSLHPVELSFKTERPFYPYREPASARNPGNYAADRALKVYYLSSERAVGTLGAQGVWPGKTQWAALLREDPYFALKNGVGFGDNVSYGHTHLTVFEDKSSPRPGTDEVYFQPSAEQSEITPPPILRSKDHRVLLPLELPVLVLFACFWGLGARAERRRAEKREEDGSAG
jgi:hypothetical protein